MKSDAEVVAVSAGRKNKISEAAANTILEAGEFSGRLFSLSEREIVPCAACNGCVESGKCVKDDGLEDILESMKKAGAIIFSGPEYWDGMNALGRAFWERVCFSTRHLGRFPLEDKIGIIVGISGDGDSRGVIEDARIFMEDARIDIADEVEVQGEYACFTCGYGDDCEVGGLAGIYDLPLEITEDIIPDLTNQCPHTNSPVSGIKKRLQKIAGEIEESLQHRRD